MRHSVACMAGLVCIAVLGGPAVSSGLSKPRASMASPALRPDTDFGNIPLYFIPNLGQTDSRALFSARAEGFTLWATRDGLFFDQRGHGEGACVPGVAGPDQLGFGGTGSLGAPRPEPRKHEGACSPEVTGPDQLGFGGAVTSLVFLNSRPDVEISAEGETAHRANFFLGRDPAGWRTNIPTSSSIRYHGLYPGIDLKVYGLGRQIEYDWVVAPGADPAGIIFRYDRARATRLDAEGDLIVDSLAGEITHKKPAAYQEIGGRRVAVACRYERLGADTYGFRVGRYDRRRPLVIDPLVIVWSSYLGGKGNDGVAALAVDAEGVVWVTGVTESADFPLVRPRDAVLGGETDMFVAAIAPAGNALLFSTFIGGRDPDIGYGITVDPAGSPVVWGLTFSGNFPVRNAYDPTFNGGAFDGVLLKLSSSGDALLFSTYLGGKANDSIDRVVLDPAGAIVVAGTTSSTNFPAVKGFDKTLTGWLDVFVAEFAADGRSLLFSTFLGGRDYEVPNGLALDAQGRIHVAGTTESPDFPVKSPLVPAHVGGADGFLTILTPNGKALVASTYFGGKSDDTFNGLALDASGSIYIGGSTKSPDFPTRAAFDPVFNGDEDGVVLKLKPIASGVVFSTYIGSPNRDYVIGVAVDAAGGVYAAGRTDSPKFPIKNAYDSTLSGPSDAFLAKFLPSGRALEFSTYFGGSKNDDARGVYLDWAGDIYIYGATDSKNFPRKSAFDPVYSGLKEGFITRLRRR